MAGRSPVQLTKRGREVAKESGLVATAARLAPGLLDDAKRLEPFEIHELCEGRSINLDGADEKELALGGVRCGRLQGRSPPRAGHPAAGRAAPAAGRGIRLAIRGESNLTSSA